MLEKNMRILHAPHNIAGQPNILSKTERLLGVKSNVLVYDKLCFNYECDINLNLAKRSKIERKIVYLINLIRCLLKYNIFHFHTIYTLLPFNLDLPFLKIFRKKIIMHYWGGDVMQTDVAERLGIFSREKLQDIYPNLDNEKKRRKLRHLEKYADKIIVGDYSLLPFSPNSIVIRQAIDLSRFPYVGCEAKRKSVKIIHAPSNRKIKGTEYVLKTIDKLKKNGYDVDFMLVENIPNHEAIEIYKTADIVVDDLLQGPYGILAIECMALGKPVIDRVRDFTLYGDLPIVDANPESLYEKLKMLIENPKLRFELGKRGRKYVEENHDAVMIARKLLGIYRAL